MNVKCQTNLLAYELMNNPVKLDPLVVTFT